ncbi:MAG: hypothetical protein Q7S58_15720 [Candidatus Binatus sp.]|uniref:hypothetical protein n=1 Tax=Candidatus Binatus sp. TaxID=2811406 RepID=UPI00271C3CF0|nr:hypothetical protein [Candidatus Binatus sp.]MDO8433849.1 hypothetical protein [Candidatus Binatus sp.]
MAEVLFDGPIILCSANGKYRIRLEVGDDGSLIATLLLPNKDDPNKWEAQHSGTGVAPLARTRQDPGAGLVFLDSV